MVRFNLLEPEPNGIISTPSENKDYLNDIGYIDYYCAFNENIWSPFSILKNLKISNFILENKRDAARVFKFRYPNVWK